MGRAFQSCTFLSPFKMRCKQPIDKSVDLKSKLCSFHRHHIEQGTISSVDAGYHRKIVLGLLQPTWDYLTEAEADALVGGRTRKDGRRLDAYTLDDQ